MPKKHYKNKRINYKILFILILICIIIAFSKTIMNNNNNIYNYKIQIILDNENITNKIQNKIYNENKKIYLSVEDIKSFFDDSIYVEEYSNTLITIGNNKVVAIKENDDSFLVNSSIIKENNVWIKKDDIDYLSISDIAYIYNYESNYITETNILLLNSLNKKSVKANVKNKINLKEKPKLISKIVLTIPKGDEIYLINEYGKYTKVRTKYGIIGYIKNSKIENKTTEREDYSIEKNKLSLDNTKEIDITNFDISIMICNARRRIRINHRHDFRRRFYHAFYRLTQLMTSPLHASR